MKHLLLLSILVCLAGCRTTERRSARQVSRTDSVMLQVGESSATQRFTHLLAENRLSLTHIVLLPPDSAGRQYPQSVTLIQSGSALSRIDTLTSYSERQMNKTAVSTAEFHSFEEQIPVSSRRRMIWWIAAFVVLMGLLICIRWERSRTSS